MRGIARRTCSMSFSKSASDSMLLPQLAMAEPKQLIFTPDAASLAATSSNASSERSWMLTPSMLRDSMLDHPSPFVTAIWSSIPGAASSAKPVKYISFLLLFCFPVVLSSCRPVVLSSLPPPHRPAVPWNGNAGNPFLLKRRMDGG